jgi:hypothetical protein
MAPEDFDEFIRTVLWRQAAQRIAHMESLLSQYGRQPDYWAADVDLEIAALQAAVAKADYVLPVDLPFPPSKEERMAQAQDLIRRYGELLDWWPAIVLRARELAAAGQLAATPVR